MQKLRLALLLLHSAIAVFAIIGCIVAGLNYGMSYPPLKTDEPIERPVLEPEDDDPGHIDHELRRDNYAKMSVYMRKMNIRASYNDDTRVWTMVPFLATAVVSGTVALLARTNAAVYRTTTVLNADLALWLLNLVYMISNYSGQPYYIDDSLKENWETGSRAVMAFNSVMLVLLAAAVVVCGIHLRLNKVPWPRCNCLNILTLNSLLTVASVVFNGLALPLITNEFNRGFLPMKNNDSSELCFFSNTYCPYLRLPATLYFGCMATLCVSMVLAIEALLSLVWGVRHRNMAIAATVLLGVANFIVGTLLSPLGVFSYLGGNVSTISYLSLVVAVLYLFQAWALWCSPKFIYSPPDILKILCGRNKTTRANSGLDEPLPEDEDGLQPCASTDVGTASALSCAAESHDEVAAVTTSDHGLVVERSQCLLTNSFLLLLSFFSLSLIGYSLDDYRVRSAAWHWLLLLMVLSAVAAKALVSLITVHSAGQPPRKSSLQTVLEVALESVLLLAAIIRLLVESTHNVAIIISGLSIIIVLLKMLELPKVSPLHNALRKLMVSRGPDCVLLTPPAEGADAALSSSGDTSISESPTSHRVPAAASHDLRASTP